MSKQYISQITSQNFVYPNKILNEYDIEIIHKLQETEVSGDISGFTMTLTGSSILVTFNYDWNLNGAEPFINNLGQLDAISVHMMEPSKSYYKPWRLIGFVQSSNINATSLSGSFSAVVSPSEMEVGAFTNGIYYFEIRFIGKRSIVPLCISSTFNVNTPTPTPTHTVTPTATPTPTPTKGFVEPTPTPTPTLTPTSSQALASGCLIYLYYGGTTNTEFLYRDCFGTVGTIYVPAGVTTTGCTDSSFEVTIITGDGSFTNTNGACHEIKVRVGNDPSHICSESYLYPYLTPSDFITYVNNGYYISVGMTLYLDPYFQTPVTSYFYVHDDNAPSQGHTFNLSTTTGVILSGNPVQC